MTWAAVAVGAGTAIAGGLSYASSSQASAEAGRLTEQQLALSKGLYDAGSPLRDSLITGTTAPAHLDLAGHVERGEMTKLHAALAQLRAAGIDPLSMANIEQLIRDRNFPALRQQMMKLSREGGAPGMVPHFLRTGELPRVLDPTPLPPAVNTYMPAREALEDQFDVAREQLLAKSGGRGGALVDAVRLLETDRAKSLGALSVDIAQQEQARQDAFTLRRDALRQSLFGQSLQMAYGQAPQYVDSLQAGASSYNQLAGQGMAATANNFSGAGSMLALALTRNAGKPEPTPVVPASPYQSRPWVPPTGDVTQGGFATHNA
jgi:hypothetical protein